MSLRETKFCKFPRSKKAARVAVAKDVIKWINAGSLSPKRGDGYVVFGESASATFKGLAKNCTVCAMGAALLSSFRLFDGEGFSHVVNEGGVCSEEIKFQLDGLFDINQLKLMEKAFEAIPLLDYETESHGLDWTAEIFGSHFKNDADCLIAIMQNVIDNEGTFKPHIQYEMV